MNLPRLAALALFAALLSVGSAAAQADPKPTPTPEPTPVPNTTDLRSFVGNYRARTEVTLGTSAPYRGRARLRMVTPRLNGLELRLNAHVDTVNGPVPVDNRLTFLPSGIMKGRNLAPGIARKAPFDGLYTAFPRSIRFNGTYKFDSAEGTFAGRLYRTSKDRIFVLYSVFANGESAAIYTYRYSTRAKPPKKDEAPPATPSPSATP